MRFFSVSPEEGAAATVARGGASALRVATRGRGEGAGSIVGASDDRLDDGAGATGVVVVTEATAGATIGGATMGGDTEGAGVIATEGEGDGAGRTAVGSGAPVGTEA